jgi:hypothetical protein
MIVPFDFSSFPEAHLPTVWHDVAELIDKGIKYSDRELSAEDFYVRILERSMQLWTASEGTTLTGIVITEIISFPNKKICQIVLVAGSEIDRWEDCLDEIEPWAQEHGCASMRAFARPGWKVRAKRRGYDMKYCIFSKSLGSEDENTH